MTSHTGTANVLYDLGFEDAADLTAKVQLAVKINDLIDRRGLTQVETSALTGMSQPKVSQIRRYKLLNISLNGSCWPWFPGPARGDPGPPRAPLRPCRNQRRRLTGACAATVPPRAAPLYRAEPGRHSLP